MKLTDKEPWLPRFSLISTCFLILLICETLVWHSLAGKDSKSLHLKDLHQDRLSTVTSRIVKNSKRQTKQHRSRVCTSALEILQNSSGLTYPGWERDFRKAHASPARFEVALSKMKKRQKMHSGDRSHHQICALDALVATGLTYPGWESDVTEAEKEHVDWPLLFESFLSSMIKKEKLHRGDRSHPQLCALDALAADGLTYSGWEHDFRLAEKTHLSDERRFDNILTSMKQRQLRHAGNCSHPQLRALDAVITAGLTYPAWKRDALKAEEAVGSKNFEQILEKMSRKSRLHRGDRSHPDLRRLDALVATNLTYSGWESDVREAEDRHMDWPLLFDDFFSSMLKKENFHCGDRSHPQLCALDALAADGLTYAGWENDFRAAETAHLSDWHVYSFDDILKSMKQKQELQSALASGCKESLEDSNSDCLQRDSRSMGAATDDGARSNSRGLDSMSQELSWVDSQQSREDAGPVLREDSESAACAIMQDSGGR